MRLRQLFDLFNAWNMRHRAPRTADYYREQIEPWIVAVGDQELPALAAIDLIVHAASRARITAVQRLFNWAARTAKIITAHPFSEVEKPPVGQRTRILDPRESVTLLRAARLDMRAVLLCGRESASRPQEIRTYRWEWLHVEEPANPVWPQVVSGHAFFVLQDYKAKNRRRDGGPSRVVPVSPRLGRLLYRIAQRQSVEGLIFRTDNGAAWSKNSLGCRMKRLRKRAGLDAGNGEEQICLYTLRHTTATRWAGGGIAGPLLRDLLGHRNLATTQRYLHLERWQALGAVREFWGRKRPGQPL